MYIKTFLFINGCSTTLTSEIEIYERDLCEEPWVIRDPTRNCTSEGNSLLTPSVYMYFDVLLGTLPSPYKF